jgi:hypothetical protein
MERAACDSNPIVGDGAGNPPVAEYRVIDPRFLVTPQHS